MVDDKQGIFVQPGLLILLVAFLYSGSLSAPFVFDDIDFFSNSDELNKYGHGFFSFELRWLPYTSLARTVEWLGYDRTWLRAGNILLHAATAIAVYFLLRRLYFIVLGEGSSRGGNVTHLAWLAFFGALLFALHPVAVYGVAYLIQRSTLMATLFMLLMLLAYLEGLQRSNWRWMLVAAACYFAAVYSKEHSIAAPGVALAMTFLIRKPSAALLRQIAPFYVIATLIALAVVWSTLSSKGVLGAVYEPNAEGMLEQSAKRQGLTELPNLQLLSVLTQSTLFFKYLWLWLIPNPAWMSVDMREAFAGSLIGWPHTAGLIGFLGYFCVAVWLLFKQGKKGLLGFAMLFPWILFVTEFSTVRIQEPFVLYRSYLWMPGLFAALPLLCGWLAPKRSYALLGSVGVLLVPLTLNRLDSFSSNLKLWSDAEKLIRGRSGVFGAERTYYNLGTELGRLKRYDEAVVNFDKAIAIQPFDFVFGNRATANFMLGKYQEALRDYGTAVSINPRNPNSYYGRALTYRVLGDLDSAQTDFAKSCQMGVCP